MVAVGIFDVDVDAWWLMCVHLLSQISSSIRSPGHASHFPRIHCQRSHIRRILISGRVFRGGLVHTREIILTDHFTLSSSPVFTSTKVNEDASKRLMRR